MTAQQQPTKPLNQMNEEERREYFANLTKEGDGNFIKKQIKKGAK